MKTPTYKTTLSPNFITDLVPVQIPALQPKLQHGIQAMKVVFNEDLATAERIAKQMLFKPHWPSSEPMKYVAYCSNDEPSDLTVLMHISIEEANGGICCKKVVGKWPIDTEAIPLLTTTPSPSCEDVDTLIKVCLGFSDCEVATLLGLGGDSEMTLTYIQSWSYPLTDWNPSNDLPHEVTSTIRLEHWETLCAEAGLACKQESSAVGDGWAGGSWNKGWNW